jgi:DegV family protein with EDD domain
MNNFEIFVDSSANLTDEIIEQNNIGVISYTCSIDGNQMECYQKGVDSAQTAKSFYQAMERGAETKTTLLNSQKIIDGVAPILESGRDVLLITISSQISGTHSQAKLAAEQLKKDYPDRKLVVCDSFNAGMAECILAMRAAHLRDMGESIEVCADWIERNKLNINSVFTVNDLKYLRRGGRISATLAIAGTLLNIKPILTASGEGKITTSGKERGRKKALLRLAESFSQLVIDAQNQTVCIAHADCEEDALALAQIVKERGAKNVIINMYDICTGSHVGPGTVALFFYGKDRKKVQPAEEKTTYAHPATAKNQ